VGSEMCIRDRAYNVEPEKILDFMFFDPGMGIKANYRRPIASGGPSETDV